MFYVYILRCRDGTLYTGVARDVAARMERHASGRGSKYVRARKVGTVVYTEKHRTLAAAMKREYQLKGWTRKKKLTLIA